MHRRVVVLLRSLGYEVGQDDRFGRPAAADAVLDTELPGVESNHRR